MKRAIIRRIETWSCEVEVPNDATEETVLDKVLRCKYEDEIERMTYDECNYEVEIPE